MADKKTMTIDLQVKGEKELHRTIDNLDKIEQKTIKAVSAQELLQAVLEAHDPKKGIEKIIPVYEKLNSVQKYLNQMTSIGVKQLQEAHVIKEKSLNAELDATRKISKADKEALDKKKKEQHEAWAELEGLRAHQLNELKRITELEKLNNKDYSEDKKNLINEIKKGEENLTANLKKNSEERVKDVKTAFENMEKANEESYAKQINSIEYKYRLEEQEIRNSTNLALAAESEKAAYRANAAADESALRKAQYDKLTDLEERKKAELKKANEQHQKDQNNMFADFIKARSEKLVVEVDTVGNKLAKSAKKASKDIGSVFESMDEETRNAIYSQAAAVQKAADEAAAAAKKEAAATKEGTAATKEAAAETLKYYDIKTSRYNLKTEIEEVEALKKLVLERYNTQKAAYDQELEAAKDNKEETEKVKARKLEFEKQYGVELIQIQQHINANQKKEQDLSLTQMVQYAQKTQEVANSVKGFTSKVGDYLSTGFTAISNVYKAEIADIDEDLKQLAAKKSEADKKADGSDTKKTELEKEHKKAIEEGRLGYAQQLQNQIDYHQGLIDDKNKYAAKEKELNLKKAKEQAKQEKIEKLNRKAALIKNIGEATANVAQGVTKTLSTYPFPFNIALAAVVGAAGAVQIGIMTKQLAKFADGGLLHGKRHSQGGMRIEGTNMEVEGGEFVVNRVSTDKNMGLIRYINEQRRELKPNDLSSFFARSPQGMEPSFKRMFADGGQLPVAQPAVNVDNDSLIKAIRAIKIEPKVAVTDIHRAQDTMVSVSGWSGV